MNPLWAIDSWYADQIHEIRNMQFSAQDRKDLEAAFQRIEKPYWVEGETGYLKIQGVLTKYWTFETWLLGGYPVPYLHQLFSEFEQDPEISSIVLLFDSPGGEVSGLGEFAEVIRGSGKPVKAHVSGMCTSAAYWLASGADELSASKTSQIGSIGVYISFLKVNSDLFEEIRFRSSKYKAPDPESDEGEAEYQKLVDEIAALFEADVAAGRNVTEEQVREDYGQGKVFLAEEASQRGLIDQVINKSIIDIKLGEPEEENQEYPGGSMAKEEKNTQAEANSDVQSGQVQAEAAAKAERDRIKGIMGLGGSQELVSKAIDENWNLADTAVAVNKELQEKLSVLKRQAERMEDAEVVNSVKQDPAEKEEKPEAQEKKNLFGVKYDEIDAELDHLTGEEA